MKAYVIAEITATDRAWVDEYLVEVTRLIAEHGARYLARTPKIEQLEGDDEVPQIIAIIEFPSREAALSFYNSAEYQPFLERRKQGSHSRLRLVDGEDFVQNRA